MSIGYPIQSHSNLYEECVLLQQKQFFIIGLHSSSLFGADNIIASTADFVPIDELKINDRSNDWEKNGTNACVISC